MSSLYSSAHVEFRFVFTRVFARADMLDALAVSGDSELQEALKQVNVLVSAIEPRLKRAHNLQKLAQLRRDLIGADNLLNSKRVSCDAIDRGTFALEIVHSF